MAGGDKNKPGVNFDLEEDADDIFRRFLEENEPAIAPTDLDPKPAQKARSTRKRAKETIDLHGLTLDEAKAEIRLHMNQWLQETGRDLTVRVITGKGRHSGPSGGVLVREIYEFFRHTYKSHIIKIDTAPSKSMIEGVPIRGHFDVTLKF